MSLPPAPANTPAVNSATSPLLLFGVFLAVVIGLLGLAGQWRLSAALASGTATEASSEDGPFQAKSETYQNLVGVISEISGAYLSLEDKNKKRRKLGAKSNQRLKKAIAVAALHADARLINLATLFRLRLINLGEHKKDQAYLMELLELEQVVHAVAKHSLHGKPLPEDLEKAAVKFNGLLPDAVNVYCKTSTNPKLCKTVEGNPIYQY